MNIRRLPITSDYCMDTTTELTVATQPFGYAPRFQAVGRPWRYEFPHQPSTSDPETQPRFTVPLPEQAEEPVPVSGAIPAPGSPPAAGPADQTQRSE